MSNRPPKVCNLFLQGKCNYGKKCKFEHSRNASASPSSRGRGGAPPRGGHRPSPSGHNPNVPRDVCRLYWTSGRCDRAFDCSFKHVQGENAPGADVGTEAEDTGVDYSSVDALAGEAGVETRPSLSPAEAHNHLKPFMADNYRFTSTSRIQGFVRVFASVHSQNRAWVCLRLSG